MRRLLEWLDDIGLESKEDYKALLKMALYMGFVFLYPVYAVYLLITDRIVPGFVMLMPYILWLRKSKKFDDYREYIERDKEGHL